MLRTFVHRLRRFLQRRPSPEAAPEAEWRWDPGLQLWYHIPSGRYWDRLRALWYDPHTHTWEPPAAIEPDQEADGDRRWHHFRHPAQAWWVTNPPRDR